ncbi:transcriptional regulator [Weissella minor]|uniref:transcriptional regulator n=1 Tax=Weissella minor TaxID=1620 RepID=UPI003AF1EDE8
MADKYDQMFENYFLGKYPDLIQLRMLELNISNNTDENVGGGRAQFKYDKTIENKLARYEQDEQLAELKSQEFLIKTWFAVLSPERQRVIQERYRNRHTSWTQIADQSHVTDKTAQRWRDDFKDGIKKWIS